MEDKIMGAGVRVTLSTYFLVIELTIMPSVYTCQKSQPKRCKFFLWDDDAKVREESAILNNSRSETLPKTPTKPSPSMQRPVTPVSGGQGSRSAMITPSKNRERSALKDDDDDFDWSASNDKALVEAAHTVTMPPPETPRKAPRTSNITSPAKRQHSEMVEDMSLWSTSASDGDVFNTPKSSEAASGLLSPKKTPARGKSQGVLASTITNSSLSTDALRILDGSRISADVEHKLVELLNKHDLRAQGIAKGRDITRLALSSKDKKINELEARIAGLEAERETSKAVIAHMKRDIVQTSPGRSRKRGS
jgi:hypothetical protein